MIEQSFKVKMEVNTHNLERSIFELKQYAIETDFMLPELNKCLLCLHYMKSEIDRRGDGFTRCTLAPVKQNKNFPELKERFVHASAFDPCNSAYQRPLRHLLLEGTNTSEVDVSSTVVYIFAKCISKDDDLLRCYQDRDFYAILPSKSRDDQKKLAQIWLQGWFNEDMIYNQLFPNTGEYLKRTALKENNVYTRNSGLFRDIEVNFLDGMLKQGVKMVNHLHDGYYVKCRNAPKCVAALKAVWGEDVKFKVKDYSKIKQKSDKEIHDLIYSLDWSDSDSPDISKPPAFMMSNSCTLITDPYQSLVGYAVNASGDCIRSSDGEFLTVPKCFVVQQKCKEICSSFL